MLEKTGLFSRLHYLPMLLLGILILFGCTGTTLSTTTQTPTQESSGSNETAKGKPIFERKTARIALSVVLSADKMKAFLNAERLETPEDTAPVTPEEILEQIKEVPKDFLHLEIIKDIANELSQMRKVEGRRIAKGRPAEDGRDGKLLLLVKKYQNPKPGAAVEFVDPRFMRTFDNIEIGTIVGRLYAPTTGLPGKEALGAEIKPKLGKPAKLTVAETISVVSGQVGQGFDTLVAQKCGYLTEEAGKLTIKEELTIQGDVNYRTGDIDFIGSVAIKGDVGKDFSVSARNDIAVTGHANSARLFSLNGSVKIAGCATGTLLTVINAPTRISSDEISQVKDQYRTDYRAAVSFTANSVHGCSVESIGDIFIEREASHSNLRTQGVLHMPKGHLFGGFTYVVCGLEARIIGTKSGSETIIALCSDVESSAEYGKLLHQLTSARTAEEVLQLHLGPYAENPNRLMFLKEPLQSKQKKLFTKLQEIRRTIENLEEHKAEMLQRAHRNPVLRVNFYEQIFPGVILRAGDQQEFRVQDTYQGPGTIEYLANAQNFVVREMLPLECSIERKQATGKI